jgi:hypothetical protein
VGEAIAKAESLRVFISYSRDDLAFADQLDAALGLHDFKIVIDRHGISGGEEWKRRLGSLIREADTVVFVLSPSSANSEICAWEVEEALRVGKRIIPVLPRPLEGARPHAGLADRNYIFFYPEPKSPGSGFGMGQVALVTALNSDLEWLREHTRYLQRATEWDEGGRPNNRLLSGADIQIAKDWAGRRPKDTPAPTELQLEFFKASEAYEAERQNEDRRRLEERERLVREAEAAQAERDAATRRVVQRTLMGLVAALLFAVLAGSAGIYAFLQRQDALFQKRQAETGRAAAEAATNKAQLTESRFLTGLAEQAVKEGDSATGILFALEALPDRNSDDELVRKRQIWDPAAVSLSSAQRMLRERTLLSGHTARVASVAVAPDGTHIVTGADDNTARVWDAKTFAELTVLTGHTNMVTSVAGSPDGARILTGSRDNTARVWDAKTFAELTVLRGHTNTVTSVAVSPDGARIVTGSYDNTARV